jgi:hypothetical protein
MVKKAMVMAAILATIFIRDVFSLPTFDGKIFGFYPITNEVSFYGNVDDSGNNRGRTLQVISINSFKIVTSFNFEFTGDFNWDMSSLKRDRYIELSLVKPIIPRISLNYQRILSSFEDSSINQFGLRISF